MAKRIIGSTPKRDGYRMPAEFEPQSGVWMLWPERNDNWRDGAKPAQRAFLDVAEAILQFEPVTVCVSAAQYQNARERLPRAVRVVETRLDSPSCGMDGPGNFRPGRAAAADFSQDDAGRMGRRCSACDLAAGRDFGTYLFCIVACWADSSWASLLFGGFLGVAGAGCTGTGEGK